MHTTKTLLALAVAALFAAAPAFAAPNENKPLSRDETPTGEHIPVFNQVDSDGNGMLDKDEFKRGTTTQNVTLAQVDTNGDGKVSRGEWDEHKKMKKQEQYP
ncbi:MAG TPA: hypothetical protein VLF18_21140 [Tahibacter sp.]|uniref:hypothetical protein n=1 Tax=Tahibacter sp. TaxID=2056211 RepID=UPI002B90ADBF|nr:hypothetical protein [Tahibacter sp.]HSX62695.1 hypothetical protein [Tahibacter sp.]